MPFTPLQLQQIDDAIILFLADRRPSEEIRVQLDFKVTINNQSVIVYEVRPHFQDPLKILDLKIAKATFISSQNIWRVFWIRGDLKWHSYKPEPVVKDIDAFLTLVNEDRYCCFFG